MGLTMILLIFCLAIFIFFSQEFTQAFKKCMDSPLLRLFLPLLVLSEALLYMEHGVVYVLAHFQLGLIYISQALTSLFPENVESQLITEAACICILTLLVPWILEFRNWRKMYIVFPYTNTLAAILWFFWAILCVLMN